MTLDDIVKKVFALRGKRVTKEGLRKALQRRKNVRFIPATPIQASRLTLDDEQVQRWMDTAEEILHDIPAAFVFNMDETGINELADAKKKTVVVHNWKKATRPNSPSHATRPTRLLWRASLPTEVQSGHLLLSSI